MALYLAQLYQLDTADNAIDGDNGKHNIKKGGL